MDTTLTDQRRTEVVRTSGSTGETIAVDTPTDRMSLPRHRTLRATPAVTELSHRSRPRQR